MKTPNLQKLINEVQNALEDTDTSSYYKRAFKRISKQLLKYAADLKIDYFNIDFGIQFLDAHYSMSDKVSKSKWMPVYSHCINDLADYQRTGKFMSYTLIPQRIYTFPNGFKESADSYINYRESIGISEKSIQISKLYLERFFIFLTKKKISNPNQITINLVFEFLETLRAFEKPTVNHTMRTVRYYLKYCFENGFSNTELFSKIPNIHYCRQSRLPSSFSSDEINTLLKSMDLANPCEKRDYAIILLITRLGLRSSDVANLKFSDIDWEKEVIRIIQKKTGKPLELPLLSDVGEAVIDYLKNARPETESKHIFVRQKPPFTNFKPGCIGALVRRHLQRSGIKLEGRKKGSHTLRHSLASRLLEHEVPLPVISEILGHTNTQTTMTYLRIDIKELKKCALEVDF